MPAMILEMHQRCQTEQLNIVTLTLLRQIKFYNTVEKKSLFQLLYEANRSLLTNVESEVLCEIDPLNSRLQKSLT